MPTTTQHTKVRRRAVEPLSEIKTARGRSRNSSLSGSASQIADSSPSRQSQQIRLTARDSSSQPSTTGNRSSLGSPGFDRLTTASYSTAATEPCLANSGKLRKLGPLHEHLEAINKYEPGRTATELWTTCILEFGSNITDEPEQPEAGTDSNLWTFWEKMANLGDVLAAAKYLEDAFDVHYLCFTEIFIDTARRLSHWQPGPTTGGRHEQDRKASAIIAGTPTVMQLLNRAAIGAARSCTTTTHSKIARIMLDAAHSIFRQTRYPTRARALLILFDIYRNTLIDLWSEQQPVSSPESFNTTPVSPKSTRLDQEYSLDDLILHIHPTILNREYLVLSTHLLSIPRYKNSWLSLPARNTLWDKPTAHLVRQLALPSKSSQAWVELFKSLPSQETSDFIDVYIRDAKAFLQWCLTAIFEGQGILDESFSGTSQPTHVISRDVLNEARLTLYWFLVARRKLADSHTTLDDATWTSTLPKFPHSEKGTTSFDAYFVLSSFIFGFCTPEPLPGCCSSLAEYAMDRLKQIMKWPCGFVWHYLQQTVSFVSRLHVDGDYLQGRLDRAHIDNVIFGISQASTADAGVQLAAELHPQPLPEFIEQPIASKSTSSGDQSKSHTRGASRVTFAETSSASSTPLSSPAKSSKKRWYSRLSMTRIEALQAVSSKSSTLTAKVKSATMPNDSKPSRKSFGNMTEAASSNTKVDDFPGDYVAIAPLMSSPTNLVETPLSPQAYTTMVPDCEPVAVGAASLAEKKVESIVSSREILLPENRPTFVVLH